VRLSSQNCGFGHTVLSLGDSDVDLVGERLELTPNLSTKELWPSPDISGANRRWAKEMRI
jgi:hypothetical protein